MNTSIRLNKKIKALKVVKSQFNAKKHGLLQSMADIENQVSVAAKEIEHIRHTLERVKQLENPSFNPEIQNSHTLFVQKEASKLAGIQDKKQRMIKELNGHRNQLTLFTKKTERLDKKLDAFKCQKQLISAELIERLNQDMGTQSNGN